jgi:CTP synthase
MNPTEHGEVFVLNSGLETDQDMGNYERFLGKSLTRDSYMTTGSIYYKVIQKERSLGYGGKCVDVVPWVPLAVIEQIEAAAKKEDVDVMLVEVGGTLGEYQNILFLEAARMMKIKRPKDVAFCLVSYLPVPPRVGEMKTKPTQFAVRTMLETGLMPDFIVGRSEMDMDKKRKEKLAFSCMIDPRDIISAPDMDSVYDVPTKFLEEGFDKRILLKLGIDIKKFKRNQKAVDDWKNFVDSSRDPEKKVKIAVVGKYFSTGNFVLSDAYVSVIEALKYSAYSLGAKAKLTWVDSRQFEKDKKSVKMLKDFDGVLVPGGFGSTGIEGKIRAIEYVRENKILWHLLRYATGKCRVCEKYVWDQKSNELRDR